MNKNVTHHNQKRHGEQRATKVRCMGCRQLYRETFYRLLKECDGCAAKRKMEADMMEPPPIGGM